jgi:hypothetical protein
MLYVKKLITAFLIDLLSSAALAAVLGTVAWSGCRIFGYSLEYVVSLRLTLLAVWSVVLAYDFVTKAFLAPRSVRDCSRQWGVSRLTAADAIYLGFVREKAGQYLTSHDVEAFVDLRRRRAN